MRVVIFAGGFGRRLWPISRSSSPKQFEPLVGDRSTVQLAVDRLEGVCAPEEIYVSTNERFAPILREQLPALPPGNVIAEPERRDLAPAVGLAVCHLLAAGDPEEPFAILWGDNTMSDTDAFRDVLRAAGTALGTDGVEMVFMGETPRFANANLGWIELGEVETTAEGRDVHAFGRLVYRPDAERCEEMYEGGGWVWNTGYFVTTPRYVAAAFEAQKPEMWAGLQRIAETIGTDTYDATLAEVYPTLESISFDDAVLTELDTDGAVVLHGEMGWSDPGTLYALKESIDPDPTATVTRGLTRTPGTSDSLVYNYAEDTLVMAVGLEGMIVVNTPEAVLVVHKDDIPKVKAEVEGLVGTDLERFT